LARLKVRIDPRHTIATQTDAIYADLLAHVVEPVGTVPTS
jgi:hypothetical protein